MTRRLQWKGVGLLLMLALVASACSSDQGSGTAGSAQTPIKIGASLPLTGDFSQPGTAAQRGYEIWRDMVNSQGGLLGRQVELVIRDDASDQNTVVSDYNRLISQDRVDLLLGTFSSRLNLPASTVAEQQQMVYVEPAGGAPELFSRGYKFLFFAQPATAPHQADLFVQWITSLPPDQRPKSVAYPVQDDPFAKPVVDSIQKQLEAAGIKTVYAEVYPPDIQNFDTIANAIKASNADMVAQGAVFEDALGLTRAFIKAGYNPKILFQTSAPSEGAQFAEGIGESNTEGIFYAVSWSPAAKYSVNQEFVAEYRKRHNNETPPEDAADAFAAAQVLAAAVTAVGKIDQVALADWLHANTVETILGPLSWDETGAPEQAFILAQWQGGKSVIVLPKDVAEVQNIVFPKPNWAAQ
jgi:branched-chain amino acid transport system substrate-binding protein